MDDFNIVDLKEARAEWCEQFIIIVKPYIIEGFETIFKEAFSLCQERKQLDKYLITFQNILSQIPKWNNTTIENEVQRIIDKSGCKYLDIILTNVHIAQLKILSTIRAGSKQKKINIDIPVLNDIIHKIYINCSREIYKNCYLYVTNVPNMYHISALDVQKNKRKIEQIIKEGILITFRKTAPIDKIIKSYLEPDEEEIVSENIEEQYIYKEVDEPHEAQNTTPVQQDTKLTASATVNETTPSETIENMYPEYTLNALDDEQASSDVEPTTTLSSEPSNNEEELSDTLKQLAEIRNDEKSLLDIMNKDDNDNNATDSGISIGEELDILPDLFDEEL